MTTEPNQLNQTSLHKAADLFVAHLDREEQACRELLAVSEQKRSAIVANKTDLVSVANERESVVVAQMARLRGIRVKLVRGLAQALELPEGVSARTIAGALSVDRPEIGDRMDDLRTIAMRAETVNLGNQSLLRHALEVVNGVLNVISGAEPQSGGYGPRRNVSMHRQGGLLDTKI